MPSTAIRFVQISDTHINDAVEFAESGMNPYVSLRAVVAAINRFSPPPLFVVHTGDVADGADRAYEHAAGILSRLRVPLYCAAGNHDDRQLLRQHMAMGPRQDLGGGDGPLCYRFEAGGEQFLVLDSQRPDGGDDGFISADQLDVVAAQVDRGEPFSLFLHHPPIETDSLWMQTLQLVNREALHELLLPARDRLRAVLCGHVHRGTHTNRQGISYITVPATSTQLTILPDVEGPAAAPTDPPAFNYVTILGDSILVKEYPVAVGQEEAGGLLGDDLPPPPDAGDEGSP